MFDILRDMKERISLERVSLELDSVLNTKAYKTMFKHYNRVKGEKGDRLLLYKEDIGTVHSLLKVLIV